MEPMIFSIDPDLQAVAEFMQRSIPTARLVSVAAGLHAMAPLLWGQHEACAIRPLTLSACGLHTQSDANGSTLVLGYAGGGSGAEGDAP